MRQKREFRIAVEYERAWGRQAHDMSYAEQLSDVMGVWRPCYLALPILGIAQVKEWFFKWLAFRFPGSVSGLVLEATYVFVCWLFLSCIGVRCA